MDHHPNEITQCRLLTMLEQVEAAEPASRAWYVLVIEAVALALRCGFQAGFYYHPGEAADLVAVIRFPGGPVRWYLPHFDGEEIRK